MQLIEACMDILDQLATVAREIKEEDFCKEIPVLNKSTIGQHMRHTLEFFTCLMNNFDSEKINYDKRDHDKVIETSTVVVVELINDLKDFFRLKFEDKPLVLESNYSLETHKSCTIHTTYFRELAYNIEHAIHHMAIMKIGLNVVAPYFTLPAHFGIAVSTIKYTNQLSLPGK